MPNVVSQIKAILTKDVCQKLTPNQRVDLVSVVSYAVFEEVDYETATLIREALGPYTEDNYDAKVETEE
jgi:hypothetical protein